MATSPPILIYSPGGGVPVGPISNPPVYSQADVTPLVEGQAYIDIVFGALQTDTDWVLVACEVENTTDFEPLNIWPGIITNRTTAGFRLQLNGMPDSGNYYLNWAVSGVNIALSLASTYVFSGPSSGVGGAPSGNFTVNLPPSTMGSATVTPNDSGGGGVFTPSSVMLTTGSPSATFTYTAMSAGLKTINVTNDGGLINPASIGYTPTYATTYTLTGPSSGVSGVASTNFTVAVSGAVSGTVVVTMHDASAGGTFTPTTVNLTTGAPSATFTYTPSSSGAKTISTTNSGGLTDPASLTYTASAPALAVSDTFTGVDGTGLPSHTMDIGSGWTRFEGAGANQMTLTSNVLSSFLDGGTGYSYQTESGHADCTIHVEALFGASTYCKIIFRYVNATNFWMLSVNTNSGTNNVELIKVVAGASTTVSTGSLSITLGALVNLSVVLSGTSISASAGATNVSTTDAFNQTATKHGIGSYQPTIAACYFDNFTVT